MRRSFFSLLVLAPALAQPLNSAENLIHPYPIGSITTSRPTIGCFVPQNLSQFQLLVDGVDLTGPSQKEQGGARWTPNYDLDSGPHTAQVRLQLSDGRQLERNWGFNIGPPSLEATSWSWSPPQITFSAPISQALFFLNGRQVPCQVMGQSVIHQGTPPSGPRRARVIAVGLDGSVIEKSWTSPR